mmetsp:Transcript_38729/g.56943  ORF Transcript_38729/g.56943 Transcript_38729/m.56943 type:complete len:86 (+) Transcript_38729:159-416(+)
MLQVTAVKEQHALKTHDGILQTGKCSGWHCSLRVGPSLPAHRTSGAQQKEFSRAISSREPKRADSARPRSGGAGTGGCLLQQNDL